LLYSRKKSVTQNIRGSIERLLRAAQSCLGAACDSQNIKQRLRTTGLKHGTTGKHQCFWCCLRSNTTIKSGKLLVT